MSRPAKSAFGARLIPRFADGWQTRRGYCRFVAKMSLVVAACAGFVAIWLLGFSWPASPVLWLGFAVAGTWVPTAIAYWLWPAGHRSGVGMAWRGLVIVASAFVAIALVVTAYWFAIDWLLCHAPSDECRQSVVLSPAQMVAFAFGYTFILGTVFTLGLPWIAGAALSAAFRSPPPSLPDP